MIRRPLVERDVQSPNHRVIRFRAARKRSEQQKAQQMDPRAVRAACDGHEGSGVATCGRVSSSVTRWMSPNAVLAIELLVSVEVMCPLSRRRGGLRAPLGPWCLSKARSCLLACLVLCRARASCVVVRGWSPQRVPIDGVSSVSFCDSLPGPPRIGRAAFAG